MSSCLSRIALPRPASAAALLCLALCLSLLAGGRLEAQPAACAPDGGLDYYGCRADDFLRREPQEALPSYYLAYGERYAERFTAETRPLLSPQGQAWLDRVRAGLQVAMEAERARDPLGFALLELDSEAFSDFAYSTHAPVYLDAGLASLPLRDLLIVGSTPDAQDILSPRGRAQVAAVIHGLVQSCERDGLGACLVSRVLIELRERRRLYAERLRLRPTGTLGGWLVRRLISSAQRALQPPRASPGARGRLRSALPSSP